MIEKQKFDYAGVLASTYNSTANISLVASTNELLKQDSLATRSATMRHILGCSTRKTPSCEGLGDH